MREFHLKTRGEVEVHDVTHAVREAVRESGAREGLAPTLVVGSTAAGTTLEYEPGLAGEDPPGALDRLFPRHGEGVEYGRERLRKDTA